MNIIKVSPQAAYDAQCQGKVDIVDVRTPGEFNALHADGARLVPLDQFNPSAIKPGRPVYLICKSGGRAAKAWQACVDAKVIEVACVDGGTDAWVAAGLPVIRGRGVISLERQVRIAAGALVLLGAALAWFVHPYFLALPAFVGAGLVFAGLTDTCGMGMLLARMPWNRRAACAKAPLS